MNGNVIYQLSFRTITPEGTIKSAMKLLPHIASLGVDYVYVTACFAADNDPDESTWSERQRKSGCKNPKNPYKIADYFHVDEEYGTDQDLCDFVEEAHHNGLKVLFDLVYFHCGKNAVFIKDHPDFVKRNPDGTTFVGENWPFALIDHSNPELREYLYSNMEYFVTEFKVDGFRCDIAYRIQLDFWVEGIKRLRKIKPDVFMLNEAGECLEYIDGGFDCHYHLTRNRALAKVYRQNADFDEYKSTFNNKKYFKNFMNYTDNHDDASDVELERNEVFLGNDGAESMLVLTFAVPGNPYIWNGLEVCDDLENCMFSNRLYGKRNSINWANALTEKGSERIKLVKMLTNLYHSNEALYDGDIEFVDTDNRLLCFTRNSGNEKLFVCINTGKESAEISINKKLDTILSRGVKVQNDTLLVDRYGYIMAKITE